MGHEAETNSLQHLRVLPVAAKRSAPRSGPSRSASLCLRRRSNTSHRGRQRSRDGARDAEQSSQVVAGLYPTYSRCERHLVEYKKPIRSAGGLRLEGLVALGAARSRAVYCGSRGAPSDAAKRCRPACRRVRCGSSSLASRRGKPTSHILSKPSGSSRARCQRCAGLLAAHRE